MLCCQGVQNIGLSNYKQIRTKVQSMITMHARFRQTDEHRDNSATIRSNSVEFCLLISVCEAWQ